MSVNVVRGKPDTAIDDFIAALDSFQIDHPDARIDIYRQNPGSIRVRIIDEGFAKRNVVERHDLVWNYLDLVPENSVSNLSTLLLLTDDETGTSVANMEFEDPVPSGL